MNYWYINTEAKAFDGESPHKKWLKHGRAFVSGVEGADAEKFAGKLQQLQRGDVIFMYANTQGIMAVGLVLERCDGQPSNPPLVYCWPRHTEERLQEYQAKVDWFLRFPHNAIAPHTLRAIIGWTSPQAIQGIPNHEAAKALLEQAHQQARAE